MFDDFFETASELTRAGRPFATAVVVRAEKPTSGKPGDRAIVTLDGVMHGWIGGSCAQPTVIREALAALAEDRSRLVRLSSEDEVGTEAGGAFPLDSARLDGVVTAPMTCFSGGTLDIFIEPQHPRPRLLIVGTLPVARALAHLGKAMNYHVCMVDPAGETSKVPTGVDELLEGAGPEALGTLAERVTPLSFFVVATHGEYDEPALRAAFATDVPYIGLVASPKRGSSVRTSLAAAGVSEKDLARMKFPAGLDIGARRGDEIALSIMAEIIQVRQGLEALTWEDGAEAAAGDSDAGGGVSAKTRAAGPAVAIDPICRMEVKVEGALHTHEWDGRTWYFCCDGCRAKFAADPEAWTAA
ncbi:MAG TPA: XdhC family protein [Gemmatimonadota bacterium]|nr:XdhC family protein [Gemmatimonadota bacterium]